MERRDFLKVTVLTGATAALSGCEKPAHGLVRFLPEEDIVPGTADWKPSLCTLCPAGCGLMVRIMQGEAEVIKNGQLGLIQTGLPKKLEGNPSHPINQGKLCVRGQAGLQLTYHPDRIRTPLKQSGPRGSGRFEATTWDESLRKVVSKLQELRSQNQSDGLRFLAGRVRGHRREVIRKFLGNCGAPRELMWDPLDEPTLRQANSLSFGEPSLPTFDLAHSNYVICFGADFLGTWNSPVAQAIGYGEMRQGHAGRRAKFVQIEQRMSQTGANADEWIATRAGTEGVLALSLAYVIRRNGLLPAVEDNATRAIQGWKEGLADYAPPRVEQQIGIPAEKIDRIAHELATHLPAVAIIGGAPLAQRNGLFNALAVNALNALLGSINAKGGVHLWPGSPVGQMDESVDRGFSRDRIAQLAADAKLLMLYNANPVYSAPPAWKARQVLEKIPFIVSFDSFLNETNRLADLILPDHSPLESWLDDVPECGSTQAVLTLAAPVMSPLHDTRSMPDVLLQISHLLGGDAGGTSPAESFKEILQTSVATLSGNRFASDSDKDRNALWMEVLARGGWWGEAVRGPSKFPASDRPVLDPGPSFDGDADTFPFHFQPYFSQAFLDGSLAHLPWMQELPDVLSTVMWNSWVEINPKAAEAVGIKQGDLVEVHSRYGKLQAAALISPGLSPDVIAMPFGQGHEQFGRYATNRGANPVTLLAPMEVEGTGAFAWAATRVSVSKVGTANIAMFAGGLFERPPELEHR